MSTAPSISKRQQKIREKQKRQAAERKEKKETYINQTPFRHVERNFKSRASLPDFSHVIDFDQGHDDPTQREQIIPLALTKDLRALSSLLGETDSTWNKRALDAYGLKDAPGFIFIPNPFTPHAQRHLVKKCLSQYTLPPSTNNLDTHYIAPIHGYWQHYEQEYRQEIQPTDTHYYAQRRAHTLPMESPYEDTTFQDTPQDTPQDTLQDTPQDTLQDTPQDTPQDTLQDTLQDTPHKACSTDFQPTLDQPKYDPLPASTVPILSPCELFRRMRWTTLGYHYHWPTKTYHLDRRFPVPDEISTLSQAVARAVEGTFYHENGATVWKNDYPGDSYRAEAGVVNYYQYRDTLMGHVDRSELNMEAPLVSLSLGHTCIYLLGGASQDIAPIPIYLRSGDIIVMTRMCRQYFHGVPRIIQDTLPSYLSSKEACSDSPDWSPYGAYMETSRINVNVRQVFS